MAKLNQYQRIVPFIIFILALYLLFNLIKPMITVLLGSTLLSYMAFPLYKKINERTSKKTLSIILALLIVVVIILIPFFILTFAITQQAYYFYNSLSNEITKGTIFGYGCISEDSKLCLLVNKAEIFNLEQLSKFGLEKQFQKIMPILEDKITNFIIALPLILAQIFISLIISYFILKEWEYILKKIRDILPMRKKTINRLIKEFGNITHTVIYAQLFVAMIQGIVGTIGFFIFGVPFPILLGVILAFRSLMPNIGTAIIWGPTSLIMIIIGFLSNDYWILGSGIGLFFYGLLIVSSIDNILLSRIVNKKTHVNQIIVIIGVIGGARMFGIIGILLPLLITYFETFKERYS
ncbi:MAG: AI-2E family transporter [Candidatus Pacearchaeota archaeon]|jgi:predicted PurR-regulated permease PerM